MNRPMSLGVCYYPEHWSESTWKPDAARMRELGITWVRVGEFAWKQLEPQPGQYNFDWLDRAVDTLGNAGLKVILGTPTATPPKWLIDMYPDVLAVDEYGRPRKFGSRRHYSFNAPAYLNASDEITRILADRYGQHEAIHAWQTDNEYGCHDTVRSYGFYDLLAFRHWLEGRYETIDALNDAWWNRFWSMDYSSFDEVDLPNLTVTEANPSHSLDFYRFSSDAVVAFNRRQVNILRELSPGRLITHNGMLLFDQYDAFKLAGDLDVFSWDSYPLGMLEQSPLSDDLKNKYYRTGHPDLVSLHHDLYYGLKNKPFWVIEQQPGQVNWAPTNPLPAIGAVSLWTWQALAHGAEVVSYFRWCAANGAQELMHAGLNLHDGTPDRASSTAKEVSTTLNSLPETAHNHPKAEVALLFDYESLWATQLQPHAEGWNYWMLQLSYYEALRGLGLNVHLVHPRDDLSPYQLVCAPALHLVDDTLATHLHDFVTASGTLVMGPRSGAKTLSNTVHAPTPGPLAPLMGVKIHHVDALRPGLHESIHMNGQDYTYSTWADILTPDGAEVVATFSTDAYEGAAAICQHSVGAGTCVTIGAWVEASTLRELLLPHLAEVATINLPDGVRITQRGGHTYLYNYNPNEVSLADVNLPGAPQTIDKHEVVMLPDDDASQVRRQHVPATTSS